MDGLWRPCALQKVLLISPDASARIFGSRFHQKIKRQLDMSLHKLKVQGQHMKQGVAYEHSYSPARLCRTRTDFAPALCLFLPLLRTCLLIMSTSAKHSFKVTCLKRKRLKVTSTSHLLQAMVRMQNVSIAVIGIFPAGLRLAFVSSVKDSFGRGECLPIFNRGLMCMCCV